MPLSKERKASIRKQFQLHESDTGSPEVQIALYRIAQEALNNVIKHARASQVTLSLHNYPEQVELRIKDDGRGFDPSHVTPGHLGLGIMRERAQSLGITFEIASQPGQGTEIVVTYGA